MCLYYRTARPPNDLMNRARQHFGTLVIARSGKMRWTAIALLRPRISTSLSNLLHWYSLTLSNKAALFSRENALNKISEAMFQLLHLRSTPSTLLPHVTRLSKIIPELIWLYTHSPSNIDLLTWQNKSSLPRIVIYPEILNFVVLIFSQGLVLH